jgi:hypothetical protein
LVLLRDKKVVGMFCFQNSHKINLK